MTRMNINNIVDTMIKVVGMEFIIIKGISRIISVSKIKKIILIKKNRPSGRGLNPRSNDGYFFRNLSL